MTTLRTAFAAGSALALALAFSSPALGQSRVITGTNVTIADAPVSVTLNGNVFTNQGLVGTGRLSANTRDFAGETMGSFSSMALDLNTWRRNADGGYAGVIYTLPDRGPNDVGPFVGTTDYRNRVNISSITFNPYSGTALPQSSASQNQVVITPTGGFFLTDTTGANFTGKDALGGITTRSGVLYPLVPAGSEGAGRISLDSEGIAFRPDGSFYVSDEYAANIYYFDPSGHQIAALNTIPAILPRTGGAVNFNGSTTPTTGRRNNQGLEAISITPDNRRLVTILQSATVQDTNGSNQQTRNNTRILVYDISSAPIPSQNPIGDYVLQLPIFNQNGSTIAAPNRTAAQSEMLALNDRQFLVLSRDGIGLGADPSGTTSTTPVFKSILLVDTTGATNLVGTPYETGTTALATNGTLVSGIVPVQQVELVNMLNSTQLDRFGMNLANKPPNATSLSEKWEAMALAPVLEENAPQDFFLFVGNDNDFQASSGFINGQPYSASPVGAPGVATNDSILLVYRLTLPTYVDPLALRALEVTSPGILIGTRAVAADLAAAGTVDAMGWLGSERSMSGTPVRGLHVWVSGEWNRLAARTADLTGLSGDLFGASGGIDYGFGPARIGVYAGYRNADGRFGTAPLEGSSLVGGLYGQAVLDNGFYIEAAAGKAFSLDLDKIGRESAYGQIAEGSTDGDGWSGSAEAGWQFELGGPKLSAGPLAAIDHSDVDLDGYVEQGASLTNLQFQDRHFQYTRYSLGGEMRADLGALSPALRAGYSWEKESGDTSTAVKLASANHEMATETLVLPDTERDSLFGGVRLDLDMGRLHGRLAAEGRWGKGEDDARVSLGLSMGL